MQSRVLTNANAAFVRTNHWRAVVRIRELVDERAKLWLGGTAKTREKRYTSDRTLYRGKVSLSICPGAPLERVDYPGMEFLDDSEHMRNLWVSICGLNLVWSYESLRSFNRIIYPLNIQPLRHGLMLVDIPKSLHHAP